MDDNPPSLIEGVNASGTMVTLVVTDVGAWPKTPRRCPFTTPQRQ